MTQTHKNEALSQIVELLEAAWDNRKFNRKEFFKAYEKQQEFFDLGLTKRERLLMAGNQLGKSEAGAFETSCHLTGEYPDWWLGKRFDRPIRAWAAGETSTLVRDVQQKKLFGAAGVKEDFGTGYVPREAILDVSSARGVTDAYDTVQVRHKSGGISTITFKSYEQGRTKFQGEPVDYIWCDEEPPADVYSEIVTRTNATKGLVILTFTPLKGMSDVVTRFLEEPDVDRGVVTMTIYDAEHYTAEERERIIRAYPAHEREARSKGTPMMGSGRVFSIPEEMISEPPLEYIPPHWFKLWGIDFGIGHPFGAVLVLWDKDNDVIHVHHAYRQADSLPIMHAAAMKPIGVNVPVAWPQDGTQRQVDGKPMAHQYKTHGLRMHPEHATWPEGGNSTEAGILEMQERMETGRFKVAAHLSQWWEEFRIYHRKDGMIVKIKDDLMSATRIAVMMKRIGKQVQLGGSAFKRRQGNTASDVDFPLF